MSCHDVPEHGSPASARHPALGTTACVQSCDMVVIVGGRTGTLGELAIAHDEGRLIGVLKGSGGITDLVEEIIRVSGQTRARVVYDDDPARLVQRLLITYETEHFRKASCFYDSRAETA